MGKTGSRSWTDPVAGQSFQTKDTTISQSLLKLIGTHSTCLQILSERYDTPLEFVETDTSENDGTFQLKTQTRGILLSYLSLLISHERMYLGISCWTKRYPCRMRYFHFNPAESNRLEVLLGLSVEIGFKVVRDMNRYSSDLMAPNQKKTSLLRCCNLNGMIVKSFCLIRTLGR